MLKYVFLLLGGFRRPHVILHNENPLEDWQMFCVILVSLNPGVERHDKSFIPSECLSKHEIRSIKTYPGRIFLPSNASSASFHIFLATWRLTLNLCSGGTGKLFTIPLYLNDVCQKSVMLFSCSCFR